MNPMIASRDMATNRNLKIWEGTCPISRAEGEILMMCRVGPTPIAILKEHPRDTDSHPSANHTTTIGHNPTSGLTCSSLKITNKTQSNAERASNASGSTSDNKSPSI